jgi:hypothetical protein
MGISIGSREVPRRKRSVTGVMMMMGIIIQNFRRKALSKETAWKTLR